MSAPNYRCGMCGQPITMYGRTKRLVDGVQRMVGRCCARKGAPK